MATKKTTTKTEKTKDVVKTEKVKAVKSVKSVKSVKTVKAVKESKVTKDFSGKYFYAVGKRKTSIAQVRLYSVDKSNKGVVVNDREYQEYFSVARHSEMIKAPLVAAGLEDRFDVSVKVSGGGIMGQAEAARLGVARALIIFDENLKKTLKDLGYLTRDARVVERKKPGKKKARRSPQWAKR